MTRPALRPVPLPALSRLILVPAACAEAFALVGLITSWSSYRSPWAAVALLVVSAALPVVLVVAPRRRERHDGLLTPRAAGLVLAGVMVVSAGMLADLPPSSWASWAAWNWGTGAMTLLGLAVYLSPRLTLVLAAGYGVLGAGSVLLGGGGLWNAHLVLVAVIVPPIGAAQYLQLYADALCRRTEAASVRALARARVEAGRRDLDVVRTADDQRLAALRERIEPLLRDIGAGAALPLDAERSATARLLAEQLREALAAQARTLWLPGQAGGGPVDVVATDAASRATGDGDRAWLAALIELLDRHQGWRRVRVVLDRRLDGSLTAVLTADGPAARAAAGDHLIQALCAARPARCDADDGLLVVETELPTKIGA